MMMSGVVSALLVIAGGGCAVAGYVLGSWHQRRALEAEWRAICLVTARSTSSTSRSPRRDQRSN